MAQRGGRRPGAGRKLAPETIIWRDWQRRRLNEDRERIYALALELAEAGNPALLAKLIDKSEPTPATVDVTLRGLPPDLVFRAVRE